MNLMQYLIFTYDTVAPEEVEKNEHQEHISYQKKERKKKKAHLVTKRRFQILTRVAKG